MSEGDIVKDQLTEGNMGAQAYFEKRVDLMLKNEKRQAELQEFLKAWWPSYKEGIRLRRPAQGAPEPVAWRYQRKIGWGDIWRCSTVPVNFETPDHWIVEPLYALTSTEIPKTALCATPEEIAASKTIIGPALTSTPSQAIEKTEGGAS